jgi:hypothetical protein
MNARPKPTLLSAPYAALAQARGDGTPPISSLSFAANRRGVLWVAAAFCDGLTAAQSTE